MKPYRMIKSLSIFVSFLILVSFLHVSVATHYCSGDIAAFGITFSGKTLSCGMEAQHQITPHTILTSKCCTDVVHEYSTDQLYTQSLLKVIKNIHQLSFSFFLPAGSLDSPEKYAEKSWFDTGPPSLFNARSVALDEICTLRI